MTPREEILAALPQYEIGEELGQGGYGVVLAGRHRELCRDVAIKELQPSLATSERVRVRFATEARILAGLSHFHIVEIYDFVVSDGLCLLVMEFLPGGTLRHQFADHGLTVETTCAVTMAVCTALHYAHARGVLHRDIKPENLLYSKDRVLKITDFGIAKVVGGDETLATFTGEILGTPTYMSPEQATGGHLGPAADVYSTGIMLYEFLSGRLPYSEQGGALAILRRHIYEDPTPLEEVAPHIPPRLLNVTMRAIARSPDDRFATAREFGDAIGEAVTPSWGPAWMARTEVQIVDPGPIVQSANLVPGHTTVIEANAGAAQTIVGPITARSPGHASPTPGPGVGGSVVVRPQITDHLVRRTGNVDLSGAKLVPVRVVMQPPPPPYAPVAVALVLMLLAIVTALFGISKTPMPEGVPPGVATVARFDPTSSEAIKLDLSQPIRVQLSNVPPDVTRVQIAFSVGGVPLPSSTTGVLTHYDHGVEATLTASTDRFLVGGAVRGDLRLLRLDGKLWRHQAFLAKGAQSGLLTVPGVLILGLALFVVAYMESLLRPLLRGHRQVSGVIGMTVLGAGLAVSLVGLTWTLGGPEPTAATISVCAACTAGAACATSIAAVRMAKRARIRPRRSPGRKPPATTRSAVPRGIAT